MSQLRSIKKPSVTHYMDHIDFLRDLYSNAKAEFERYSYIKFSEDLGLSKTNVLHLIIRGKRPLSQKAAEKIAIALEFKGPNRRYWLNLVQYHLSKDSTEREEIMREMLEIKTREVRNDSGLMEQLEFFTEWYHSIVYELSYTDDFSSDPKVLATMLTPRIRPEQARQSLELLQRMNLLILEGGRLVPKQTRISTGDEIASMAVVRYHQSMIDLGKGSLTDVASDLRDISAISFACSASLVPDIKKEISLFRKKMLDLADALSSKEVVYQMNVQLFPLSRKKGAAS